MTRSQLCVAERQQLRSRIREEGACVFSGLDLFHQSALAMIDRS
jgi:hypothetical protein